MVKPPLRTKSIGFKVSEEEYAQLETAAQATGRSLGESCREVMLASANGQPQKAGPGGSRGPGAHGRTGSTADDPAQRAL